MTPARIVAELLEVEPDEIRPKDYLRQIPKREEEYWAFARSEAAHPETTHRHDQLIANPTITDYDEEGDWTPELGVIVYRDGTVTNRWSDGTAEYQPTWCRPLTNWTNCIHLTRETWSSCGSACIPMKPENFLAGHRKTGNVS